MPGAVLFLGPPELTRWASRAGLTVATTPAEASAIAFTPEREPHAVGLAQTPEGAYRGRILPRIACLAPDPDEELLSHAAIKAARLRADAYCCDAESLSQAFEYAASGRARAIHEGPLRLAYVGSLGTFRPGGAPRIGHGPELPVAVADSVFIGRMAECEICLRTGPHSDQNLVARRHARVQRTETGARITDLGSTNGTFLNGEPIQSADLRPGDELAIAWVHRVRLVGSLH